MINYNDKVAFNMIAGGVLGQFFVSTDTRVQGCTAVHNSAGNWTITLPEPISKPNYMFLAAMLNGFSPGMIIKMTDVDTTHKSILITNSSDGTSMDGDVSFVILEIPTVMTAIGG